MTDRPRGYNDGPGAGPRRRAQSGFMAKVTPCEPVGIPGEIQHWPWTGPLNFAGSPSFRRPDGKMDNAALVAWELFRGKRVPGLEKTCDVELCVAPACHREPPKEKRRG